MIDKERVLSDMICTMEEAGEDTVHKLFAEIERLQEDLNIAIEALNEIAFRNAGDPAGTAEEAMRRMTVFDE